MNVYDVVTLPAGEIRVTETWVLHGPDARVIGTAKPNPGPTPR